MSNVAAAAALLSVRGLGRRSLAQLLDRVPPGSLADVCDSDPPTLIDDFGLPPSAAEQLPAALRDAQRLQPEFDELGVGVVVRGADDYPQRLLTVLGPDAPPFLFYVRNVGLASRPAVGFCGSRKASEKGLHVAGEAAAMLAGKGLVIVSGYASGVDLTVHHSALESGGTTIFVLAEGILHFRAKRQVAPWLSPENHLVISEFPPRLPWLARSAMQRNRTIIGLTDAMILIESGLTGGTHACGEATLKYGGTLFVADYAVPAESAAGNQYFLRHGAVPLRGNRQGVPILDRVLRRLADRRSAVPARQPAPSLFGDE